MLGRGIKKVKLGDVCHFMTGDGINVINNGHIPVYGGNGIMGYVNDSNFSRCVIIGRVGAYCGNVYFEKNKCWITDNAITFSTTENIEFMYYLMKSLNLHSRRIGTSQPLITQSILKSIEVDLPDLNDQKAIADVLSSFDDKIELNNKVIKNLEEQAQSLYKHWFIDFEFPNENGKTYKSNGGKFKQSELGLIPEDWNCLQIYDVCKRITKKVSKNKYEVLSAINSGELIPSKEYFDKQVFSQNIERYICVEPNCFAYNPARANIGSIGMNKFDYIGCVSPVYVVVKFEDFYEWFWEYTIKNENFKEIIKLRSSGSVRQNFDFNSFASIKIIYPSKKSVVDFNNQFLNINAKLEQLKTENQKLTETRDYLLPKLISGEVKVRDIK